MLYFLPLAFAVLGGGPRGGGKTKLEYVFDFGRNVVMELDRDFQNCAAGAF